MEEGPAWALTYEWLHRAVDMLVLFEARGCGEGLATVRAGMGPGTDVLRAYVTLEVAGVREHLERQKPLVHAPPQLLRKPGHTKAGPCPSFLLPLHQAG